MKVCMNAEGGNIVSRSCWLSNPYRLLRLAPCLQGLDANGLVAVYVMLLLQRTLVLIILAVN